MVGKSHYHCRAHTIFQCWQNFSGQTPIEIDFEGLNFARSIRQTVTFDGCIFENIQYGPTDVPNAVEENPDLTALIVATSSSNTVIIRGEWARGISGVVADLEVGRWT